MEDIITKLRFSGVRVTWALAMRSHRVRLPADSSLLYSFWGSSSTLQTKQTVIAGLVLGFAAERIPTAVRTFERMMVWTQTIATLPTLTFMVDAVVDLGLKSCGCPSLRKSLVNSSPPLIGDA